MQILFIDEATGFHLINDTKIETFTLIGITGLKIARQDDAAKFVYQLNFFLLGWGLTIQF